MTVHWHVGNCPWIESYAPLWRKPIRIVLTIAHLDQDITNNDHKNLMALCQRCHIIWDKKHKQKKRGTGR